MRLLAPLIKERPNSKCVCKEKGSINVLSKRIHFLCPLILNYIEAYTEVNLHLELFVLTLFQLPLFDKISYVFKF
jgi:hypothetical protein